MSVLITVFLLVFVTRLISWIGQSVLLDFFYTLHLRLTQNSKTSMKFRQTQLKSEILNNKSELLKTSAQDQFAKWAKLRRSVDKGLAELEKLNTESTSHKSAFTLKFNTLLWALTTGLQFFIGWWYSRQAVFYLPKGWFGPIGWWLSLPFAPRGAVSVGIWSMACKRVIMVFERVVRDFIGEMEVRSGAKTAGAFEGVSGFGGMKENENESKQNEKGDFKERKVEIEEVD